MSYYLKVRARINQIQGGNPNDIVATVHFDTTSENNIAFFKNNIITDGDLEAPIYSQLTLPVDIPASAFTNNEYTDITIPFVKPNANNWSALRLKIDIEWKDTRDLYIDNISIYTPYYYQLFLSSPSVQESMRNDIRTKFTTNFSSRAQNPLWAHPYLDEAMPPTYRCASTVSNISQEPGVLGTGKYVTGANNTPWFTIDEIRWAYSVNRVPYVLYDHYPIRGNVDSVSTNTAPDKFTIQSAWNELIDYDWGFNPINGQNKNGMRHCIQIAHNYTPDDPGDDIPFYHTMQTCAQKKLSSGSVTSIQNREPSYYEILAQGWLAMCYGAKGLMYYTIFTNTPNSSGDAIYGLFESQGQLSNNVQDPARTQVTNTRYDAVKKLNQQIDKISSELLQLTWRNGYSIHTGQLSGSYISNVSSATTSGAADASISTFVELGTFRKTSNFSNDNLEYFMAVNRRTLSTETRNITVTFNKSSSYTTWKVSEIGTNNIWIVSKIGGFQTTYSPGEGKLFKFEPLFLNSSETFSGNVYVNNSLTISAGKTLTIQQGTKLKFNNSSSLIANGILNAVGTSSNKITFTSQSGTSNSSWGTITLNGSGAAGSTIKYANVKYGTKVEAINTSNITIQYCNIDTTYDGIRFYNSSGSILNNTITTNSIGHGIIIENGSTNVTVNDNVIKKTYTDRRGVGIYFGGGAGGTAARNDIYGWDWGICAIWSSSPTSHSSYYIQKNNRIRNCNTGLMVYRLSYPTFGIPGPSDYYNWNSISGNSFNAKVGTYYPEYESRLFACNNWWGSNTPNTALFQVGASSYFYYTPYLSSDPWAGIPKIAASNNDNSSTLGKVNQTSGDDIKLLLDGIELRLQNKFEDAKNYFMSYLADHPDNQQAYVELYNCYSKETADEIIKFFNSLPEKASKDHKLLLSYLYLKNGDVKEAKEINNTIIVENPNTELATKAKLNNVYIALYNEDNINEAITIFNEVLNKIELSTPMELSLVHNAIETYANTYGKEINGLSALPYFESSEEKLNKQDGSGIPNQYALLGNYPNPFNPSTTISYASPYQSSVELIIYDIMGREVKSFNVSSQSAGYNRLVWNGRNESGNPITSGVYFYRISIKSLENNETFVKTAKLMMLK